MQTRAASNLKDAVRGFWEESSCGEIYAEGGSLRRQFETHAAARYALEPYIRAFAGFDGRGRDVLEIGVGMGADHVEWARSESIVGYMLWARYGLGTGHPRRSLADIYAQHLESPGTKGFTLEEGRELAAGFSSVTVWSELGFGDLLQGEVGERHRGPVLEIATRVWPRGLIRRVLPHHGLMLLIRAVK